MKIVIRADASLDIGTGHVMRCLTLAQALKESGYKVDFICRKHKGNLIERIVGEGFKVHVLPKQHKYKLVKEGAPTHLTHAYWLGETQQKDAEQCEPILSDIDPDWLIVDHYAIDETWHRLLKENYKKLMVIDDLADRKYYCDLLLDQTYGREYQDYKHLVPDTCEMLLGSKYALLRPEFSDWRDRSLRRRASPKLKSIIITMGGVDSNNVTGQILSVIKGARLPEGIKFTVVMGGMAPFLNEVKNQAKAMPYSTKVYVDVTNIAELMASADLAIGAAGATTWERCCLGLPSIQLVIAENQRTIAEKLAKDHVVQLLSSVDKLKKLIEIAPKWMLPMSLSARKVCDGLGAERVLNLMLEMTET